jgi:hypothetical protein
MSTTPTTATSTKTLTNSEQMDDRAVLRLLCGLALEHQRELLNTPQFRRRVQPELLRRLQRRVARELAQQRQQIDALRTPCRCRRCLKRRSKPFPAYYVVNRLSYECHLERQQIDPELEEILAPLRNDRTRVGSVVIARSRPHNS